MRYCIVNNCKSTLECEDIILFGFPKQYTAEWVKVVNIPGWLPKKGSVICSLHFPSDVIQGKRLVPGAFPIDDRLVNIATGNALNFLFYNL